jgi:hypothetical protein
MPSMNVHQELCGVMVNVWTFNHEREIPVAGSSDVLGSDSSDT